MKILSTFLLLLSLLMYSTAHAIITIHQVILIESADGVRYFLVISERHDEYPMTNLYKLDGQHFVQIEHVVQAGNEIQAAPAHSLYQQMSFKFIENLDPHSFSFPE